MNTQFSRPRRWVPALLLASVLLAVLPGCDSVESLEREALGYLAKGDRISASIQFRAVLAREPGHAEANFQLGKILAEVMGLPEAETSLKRAMELGKPAPEVMPVLGPVLLELEKYKELLELLAPDPKRAQPTDAKGLAEYAVLRGRAYLGLRDATSANTQFQIALSALPDRAKLGLARIAQVNNDQPRAEELVEEVVAASPRSSEARLALAELKRASGQLEKALPEFAEATRLDPNNVNTVLLNAIALISANRAGEARPLLEKARKMAPAGPLLHFSQALVDFRDRRYKECAEGLEKVFNVLPQYMPALLLAGQLNYATGNFEQAQDAFVRYLQRFPSHTHARKMLAATLLSKNQPQIAMNVLRPMLGKDAEDPELLGLAGQALLHMGHTVQARSALARAVKLIPDNPEFRTALAVTHLAAGLRRRAEADFRAAIALKPGNTKADYGLTMMLLAENRIDAAKEAVAEAEKRLPVNPETHMLKGVVARAAGDASGARKAFQRAAELDPGFFPAIHTLADLDIEEGKPDAARARIQEVLRKNGTHLDAMIAMAQLEFQAGRRGDGMVWMRRATDAHPDSPHAQLLVAEAQAQAGEISEAIGSIKQALKLRPREPRALKTLGQVQMAAKDYNGAVTTFTTLVSVQPGATEAHLLLASAHLAANDPRTAIAVVRTALKRNPASREAKLFLGRILLNGKKYGEVLELAHQLQLDAPKSSLGFRLEGDALLAQGDARRAVKAFEAAARLEPSGEMLAKVHHATGQASPGSEREGPLEEWVQKNANDGATRLYLADVLFAKGRHRDAIVHYEELARLFPKDARTLNNLAWALHTVKDPRAVDFAERAYQLNPGQPAVVDTFGWVLVSRGRLNEGIQMLLKAVTLDGSNPEIRYHLAQALAQAGDKTRARAELKTLLGAGKPFPQMEEARALLGSLGP